MEHIAQGTIISAGPHFAAVASREQPDRDAIPLAAATHAPSTSRSAPSCRPISRTSAGTAFELESWKSRDNAQAFGAGEKSISSSANPYEKYPAELSAVRFMSGRTATVLTGGRRGGSSAAAVKSRQVAARYTMGG